MSPVHAALTSVLLAVGIIAVGGGVVAVVIALLLLVALQQWGPYRRGRGVSTQRRKRRR